MCEYVIAYWIKLQLNLINVFFNQLWVNTNMRLIWWFIDKYVELLKSETVILFFSYYLLVGHAHMWLQFLPLFKNHFYINMKY